MDLMNNVIECNVHLKDGSISPRRISIKRLWFGRYCHRNIDATQEKLDNKRTEGYFVHPNPNICSRSRYLLTNENIIEVQGPQTSGEVEVVAIVDKGEVMISVGSDHNDRSLEDICSSTIGKIYDSAKTKQMAPAVLAKDAWRYEDVKDHWDSLNLRSSVTVSNERIDYQNFTLSDLVDLEYHFKSNPGLKEDGVVIFGGTSDMLPTVPSHVYQFRPQNKPFLVYPQDFHFEVRDPILHRTISHFYTVQTLEDRES
jgi:hypothetical protein